MDIRLKLYITAVICSGILVLGSAATQWPGMPTQAYWLYLALAVAAGVVKLRLPGMPGTYSLSFFFALYGLTRFSLPETLIASCLAALAQSLLNSKAKPSPVQLAFNMANLCVSVGACQAMQKALAAAQVFTFRPAQLVLVAACYFIVNTGLVSGVLSLLQGKALSSVAEEWYVWSFPYYLIGVTLLGLLPAAGEEFQPEAVLILLPLVYLVHFYYGLSNIHHQAEEAQTAEQHGLPPRAKLYVDSLIGLGCTLLAYGLFRGGLIDAGQCAAYLVLTGLASLCKITLPRMDGTISLNFVLLLVAVTSLSLTEVVLMSALAGAVQSVWKMSRRPQLIQVLFNAAALLVSSTLAWLVCRELEWSAGVHSLPLSLALATLVLYGSNTLLVAAVLCLVQDKPISAIWQNCCFWSFPYYMVGAVLAGLMIATRQVAGWAPAAALAPVLTLIYVSYRAHLVRSQRPVALAKGASA